MDDDVSDSNLLVAGAWIRQPPPGTDVAALSDDDIDEIGMTIAYLKTRKEVDPHRRRR